ncbi:hypothetical protein K1719_047360 [Acacia pycnantha]|nr:hypothetical protein K1719_047360 [Acacia pycnantha]
MWVMLVSTLVRHGKSTLAFLAAPTVVATLSLTCLTIVGNFNLRIRSDQREMKEARRGLKKRRMAASTFTPCHIFFPYQKKQVTPSPQLVVIEIRVTLLLGGRVTSRVIGLVDEVDDMIDSGMAGELAEFFDTDSLAFESEKTTGLKKTIGVPELHRYFKRYPPPGARQESKKGHTFGWYRRCGGKGPCWKGR